MGPRKRIFDKGIEVSSTSTPTVSGEVATLTASDLYGQPFASGTKVTADGVHFGFDLTAGAAQPATTALQQAVGFVAPTALPLAPFDMVGVEIDLNNKGTAATLQINENLPTGLDAVFATPDAWISPAGTLIEWSAVLQPQTNDVLRYLARLPDAAGTYTTTTTVLLLGTGGPQTYKTVTLDLAVANSPTTLMTNAQRIAAALPTSGSDANVRKKILADLVSVQLRTVKSRGDAEKNIEDLLDAVGWAEKLKTIDPTQTRLALDELIRYWEARWYSF